MDYVIEFSKEFEKSFEKLKKKNKIIFQRIRKKLLEIVKGPKRFKHLKNVLAGYIRIQFGSFVLVYKIEGNIVKIISLDHHHKNLLNVPTPF